TNDVAQAVADAKGGAVEFRVEKAGIVHAGVGKASFPVDALVGNLRAFLDAVQKAKPAGAKGAYLEKMSLSSTMGPGLRIDPAALAADACAAYIVELPPAFARAATGRAVDLPRGRPCPRLQVPVLRPNPRGAPRWPA